MIVGLKKGHTNSGSFKKGERRSRKTEFKKGQKTWNNGLTKETSKIIRKYADKQKGRGKGKRRSIKTEFKKGQKPWNKGKILVPLDEQRKKINERAREKYAKDIVKSRKKNRTWYQKHKEQESVRGKKYREKYDKKIKQRSIDLKLEVFSHYSKLISNSDVPVCACINCGEKHIEFLTLDHISGRKSMNHKPSLKAEKLWHRLRRGDYPKGIQVLCWNCNSSKSNNPFCPVHEWYKYHQKESRR